jgi:hypothetical protein
MPYTILEERIINQAITETSTTKTVPVGTVINANDPIYGEGEFVYLAGVASTAIGDAVIFDQYAGTTTRAVSASRGPVAIAMSANVASSYGWYQIRGSAVVKSATAVAGARPYVTATAGTIDDAVSATNAIDGANYKTADGTPSAGFAVVQIAFPALNGNG